MRRELRALVGDMLLWCCYRIDRRTSGTVDKLGHGATDIRAIGARSHGFDEVRSQGKTGSHRWSRGNQTQRQWAEEEK